jgi:hypothetical protein
VPGTLVMILVPILVKIDKPDLTLLKGADYLGMVLMALSLGCLQYVLEEGARWDWLGDDTIRICAWIAGLAGIGFIIRSMTFARPVVDLRALANRNFSLGCWFSFVNGVGIFGLVYLAPLFLGRVRGFIAWQIGGAILAAGLFQPTERLIYLMLVDGHYRKYLSRLHERLGGARLNVVRAFENIGLELFVEPADGMFVWARFPHVDDSLALAEASQRDGIMLAPGAVFRPHLERSPWMRFNVAVCEDTRVQHWLQRQASNTA